MHPLGNYARPRPTHPLGKDARRAFLCLPVTHAHNMHLTLAHNMSQMLLGNILYVRIQDRAPESGAGGGAPAMEVGCPPSQLVG